MDRVSVKEQLSELNFADNLKWLRLSRILPLSQEHVARRIGITRASYSNYENGRRIPPLHVVIAVAEYFMVEITSLLMVQNDGEDT